MWIINGHDHKAGQERRYEITGTDSSTADEVLAEFNRVNGAWVRVLSGPDPTHPLPLPVLQVVPEVTPAPVSFANLLDEHDEHDEHEDEIED